MTLHQLDVDALKASGAGASRCQMVEEGIFHNMQHRSRLLLVVLLSWSNIAAEKHYWKQHRMRYLLGTFSDMHNIGRYLSVLCGLVETQHD